MIIQFGLNATPLAFQSRVKKFLKFYLGGDDAPVPFGGRSDEIDKLNRWLASDTSARNLLVTAPAGRGKTALLVRWIAQLDHSWPVAFVPISIRYDTNRANVFYQALAARLASILKETLPSTPTDPAQFYKEKVIEYLYRFEETHTRCLIVVDGLDEANGWDLDPSVLPVHPPAWLRIVASARQLAGDRGSRDWLYRLGWKSAGPQVHTIEVKPLKREGVKDVLQNMGFPLAVLARDVDIVDELFRLTERGDPLLLGWCVSDLWDNKDATPRLRPEDLKNREPGYNAYFKSWLDEQRKVWHESGAVFDEEEINTLLAVLACALGPITLAGIGEMMQRILKRDCFVSKPMLEPLRRFVIGDGIHTGYALGHPKLADFLRHEYFGDSHIIGQTERTFVAWGRDVVHDLNSGAMQPDEVPSYSLLFYVQHLESEQREVTPLMYRELVEDGWRRAWLAHDEGLRGFARDIDVVWARLKQAAMRERNGLSQPLTGLGGLIRCALCLSSIRSIGAAVPPNFLAELLRRHSIGSGQALHLSRLKTGESEKAMALRALAPCLATEILHEAIADARALRDPKYASVTLAALAQRLPQLERDELIDDALRIARTCPEYARDRALKEILKLRLPEYPDEAPATPDRDANALPASAAAGAPVGERPDASEEPIHLLAPDEIQAAIAKVLHCRSPWQIAAALAPVVQHMSSDEVEEAFANAMRSEQSVRFDIIKVLAPHLGPELLDEALTHVFSTGDAWFQRHALGVLIPVLPPPLMEKALEMSMQGNGYSQYLSLQGLEPWLPDELLRAALAWVLKWNLYLVDGLTLLAPRLSADMISEAMSAMPVVPEWERPDFIDALLPHFQAAHFSQALDAVLACEGSDARKRGLSSLLPSLPAEMLPQLVSRLSDNLAELDVLLPYVPEELRASIVGDAYKGAFRIGDPTAFIAAYTALASRLTGDAAQEAIEVACNVEGVEDGDDRAIACLILSGSRLLPEEKGRELIDEMFRSLTQSAADPLRVGPALALSPRLTTAEADALANAVIKTTTEREIDGDEIFFLSLLLFCRKLSEERRKDVFQRFFSIAAETIDKEGLGPESTVLWLALLALLPMPTELEAQDYITKALNRMLGAEQAERCFAYALAALSPHLPESRAEQLAYQSMALTAASALEKKSANVLPVSVLAPYLPDRMLSASVSPVLDSLFVMERAELLAVISVIEGRWGDIMGLTPALAHGAEPRSWLQRLGGDAAVSETFASVRDVQRWWP